MAYNVVTAEREFNEMTTPSAARPAFFLSSGEHLCVVLGDLEIALLFEVVSLRLAPPTSEGSTPRGSASQRDGFGGSGGSYES